MRFQYVFHTTKTQKTSLSLVQRYYTRGPNDEVLKPVNLAYASYENKKTGGNPPLLVVHGYLASKRNLVSFCKKILQHTKPERKVIAVDLRNHGDSPHTLTHTNLHCVEDLKFFLESHQIKLAALMGHSYGGIVSIMMALLYPELIQKVIIEDMAPKEQTKNLEHVKSALEAISQVSVPPKIPMSTARSLVNQQLSTLIPEPEYRSFLLTQLVQKTSGKYSWRFNVEVLRENVLSTGVMPEIRGKIFDKPAIFIAPVNSDFHRKSDEPDILRYFPRAEFKYIEDSGHSIHADKLEEFAKACTTFLNKKSDDTM